MKKALEQSNLKEWRKEISIVKDFPKKGIVFYDLFPIFADYESFNSLINEIISSVCHLKVDYILSPDARGFLIGPLLAILLKIGFVPIRKKNKIAEPTYKIIYDLEYGTEQLEIDKNNFKEEKDLNVLVVDDVCATGNTFFAIKELLKKFKNIKNIYFFSILNISNLNSTEQFKKYNIFYKTLIYTK